MVTQFESAKQGLEPEPSDVTAQTFSLTLGKGQIL